MRPDAIGSLRFVRLFAQCPTHPKVIFDMQEGVPGKVFNDAAKMNRIALLPTNTVWTKIRGNDRLARILVW